MKVIEMAGIGPGPMCAMLLADLGATVLRVDRVTPVNLGRPRPLRYNLLLRNRPVIGLDLKKPAAVQLVLRLAKEGDAMIEGFRPGVMERLGLGPDECLKANPGLVYGRMTGWGQNGPLSTAAGHDINYIALTGALDAIGRRGGPPTPPLNLVGDYGGGALYLAFGIMCALFERRSSGKGQVVDAAITDGVASLMASIYGLHAAGLMSARGTNATDTGSHFYNTYQCADGKWISVAALEPKFYEELMRRLNLSAEDIGGDQWDQENWENAEARFASLFHTKTRAEWSDLLEGTDACFAPVLSMTEAPDHPHLKETGTFIEVDGIVQPGPAPRFSRSVPSHPTPPAAVDPATTEDALSGWLPADDIASARAEGAFE
jgi:crotonobetainyl-CoA:carnitine CoA-transferase CaiB-like acyl-CoA transferase